MPLASRIELPERYRVTRHIASGGMASVWEVEDLLLARAVAVKVLGAQYAADRGARARFQREARTAARVSEHAHIATIYDTGEHGQDTYIVMEYFSGGTVADRLRAAREGDAPVDQATALRWLREAAAGLDAAHGAGIVHRDVKPANLLLDANDRLAVGDFGIARLADDTHMTQTGQVLGTAAYLSPEQALGQPATPASDRYALAVVAYELLTGQRPYAGGPVTAQARQHVEDQPERASAAEPKLPPAIDAAFERGLAKDPHGRPHTAAALVEEIGRALGGRTTPTAPLERTQAMAPIAAPAPVPVPVLPTGGGRRREAAPAAAAAPRAAAPADHVRRPGERASLLPIGIAALVVAAVVAVAIALAGGGDGDDATRASTTTPKTSASSSADKQKTTATPASTADPATPPPPPPPAAATTDSATPSALNDAGYAKFKAGDFAAAVPLLQRSVDGFKSSGTTSNANYHFAIYNLATALMGAGRPAEAVPYLEERLRISTDRPGIVRHSLKEAQAQVSGDAPAPGAGKAKAGKAGKRDKD